MYIYIFMYSITHCGYSLTTFPLLAHFGNILYKYNL